MANRFSEILKQTACYGVVSFNFLLAKETGMFKTLIESKDPLTCQEIAIETHIKERYAQEMLGCLSAVGLVNVASNKDATNVYHLEKDAKDALQNGGDFALPEMNYVKILMTRYNAVLDCVGSDKTGVVRYEQSFFDLIDEHRVKLSPEVRNCMMGNVKGLKENLEKGIDVIEFGCGSACTLVHLATMFPNSQFTATDVSSEIITPLRKKYSLIPNLDFGVVDLNFIPDPVTKKYDWLYTNDVIHDLPHPVESLKGIRRMMKKDGVCTLVEPAGSGSHIKDVKDLFSAFIYTMSTFACVPESFQTPDSEAHGLAMGKETVINAGKAAGFDMTVINMTFNKGFYIGRHQKESCM